MGVQSLSDNQIWQDMPTLLAAAHELKSPLLLIRQLALQLEESSDDVSLERIRLTAEKSLRLVEALTRSSRLEDSLFETEPLSISALYCDVAHELTPLAKALEQSIEVKLPRRPCMVVGNMTLLRSILLGLCDNALTHNSQTQPVVLSAKKVGDRVQAEVRDFGPQTDTLRSISRQIGTIATPLSSRPRSSGLGLLIAKQFADQMQAEITLRRHREGGATFAVVLPESRQLSLLGS